MSINPLFYVNFSELGSLLSSNRLISRHLKARTSDDIFAPSLISFELMWISTSPSKDGNNPSDCHNSGAATPLRKPVNLLGVHWWWWWLMSKFSKHIFAWKNLWTASLKNTMVLKNSRTSNSDGGAAFGEGHKTLSKSRTRESMYSVYRCYGVNLHALMRAHEPFFQWLNSKRMYQV